MEAPDRRPDGAPPSAPHAAAHGGRPPGQRGPPQARPDSGGHATGGQSAGLTWQQQSLVQGGAAPDGAGQTRRGRGRGRGRGSRQGQYTLQPDVPQFEPGAGTAYHPGQPSSAALGNGAELAPPAQQDGKEKRRPRRREKPRGAPQPAEPAPLAGADGQAQQPEQRTQAAVARPAVRTVPRPPRAPRQAAAARGPPRPPGLPAAAEPAHAAEAAEPAAELEGIELPHCLVCCHEMREVCVGECNHKQVCGDCTLRLRLCYGKEECPLCKKPLQAVVVALWRPGPIPDWEEYQARPELVARSARFADGRIMADRWAPGGRLSSRLLADMERRTALSCSLCDARGERPFRARDHLSAHVRQEHGQRLCDLCLKEGRVFALELPCFAAREAYEAHAAAAHPRCRFCARRFYDSDALWEHMHQAHYHCTLCAPGPGGSAPYFATAPDLQAHMREDHFACEDPECAACLVAFATPDELRRHVVERHSARMPRWDPARARPMALDVQFNRRPGPGPQDGPGRRRRGGSGDVRLSGVPGGGAPPPRRPAGFGLETEGGLHIVDDDWGMSDAPLPPAAGRGGPRAGAGTRQPHDDFPRLGDAAAPAAAAGEAGGGVPARRPPPLVKRTVKCPCGRRASHFVSEEGQPLPELGCDAVCQLEARRAALAGAFGVGDPAAHVPHFDRQRPATYSGALLAAAKRHPRFVEGLERELAAFVADTNTRRALLPPMPREQRALVHELAAQYGLASSGVGAEPQRRVELFRTPGAALPSRLLSRVAPTVPDAAVAAMLREAAGHPMRLTDVAPTADVRYYLRRWEGGFTIDWQGSDAAVVRFEREGDLRDALDSLGGGIRGLFRIDRTFRPKTAVCVGEAVPAAGPREHRAPWSAAEAAGGGGDTGGSWTAVAAGSRPPERYAAPAAPPPQAAGAGAAEPAAPAGWTVIGSKRGGVKPRAMAAPSSAAEPTLAGLWEALPAASREPSSPRLGGSP